MRAQFPAATPWSVTSAIRFQHPSAPPAPTRRADARPDLALAGGGQGGSHGAGGPRSPAARRRGTGIVGQLPRVSGADSRAAPCGASGRAAGGAAVVLERLSDRGHRPDPCGNTLQGLNSSPWVLPSRPPGRGRPAAAGDGRGSVRKKRTFWLNSLAARNMTGFVFRICQEIPRSRIPLDRPVDRAAGRAQRATLDPPSAPARPPCPRQRTTAAAARAWRTGREPWLWSSTLDSRSPPAVRGPGPPGGRVGLGRAAGRRRARRPAPAEPLAVYFCTDRRGRSHVLHWRAWRWVRLATTGLSNRCGWRRRICRGTRGIPSTSD